MSLSLHDVPSARPARHPALPEGTPVAVNEVLSGALGQALAQLPGVTAASLTTGGRAGPAVLVHHGPAALTAYTLQRQLGAGPTLEALRQGREFAARTPAAGAGAVRGEQEGILDDPGPTAAITFALALPVLRRRRHGARAALTLYGSSPGGLGALRHRARPLADHLGDILRLGEDAERARRTVTDMNRAVDTRAVIDQAIGVLMARERCTATEAFGLLRRTSRSRNTKLRDVCQEVVDGIVTRGPA
ncbi:ANTAR domain-containing protein [Kitasatospora sp. NPDC057223]|uniref:ANTAR domain-containing protein n=1 Tax=Kitasatospora sp. NPDC057223 TaxID=3346055 RepID=UPI003631B228